MMVCMQRTSVCGGHGAGLGADEQAHIPNVLIDLAILYVQQSTNVQDADGVGDPQRGDRILAACGKHRNCL